MRFSLTLEFNEFRFIFRFKTLHFEGLKRRAGCKNCIELIAVHSANLEENFQTKSYLRCFKRFIDYLPNFDALIIHFEESDQQILYKDRPRVIDPVNPYNNLAANWNSQSDNLKKLKSFAKETKNRLNKLANSKEVCLDKLFEAQPANRVDIRNLLGLNSGGSWMVEIKSFSSLPDLEIHNKRFQNDHLLSNCLDYLMKNFQMAVNTSESSGYDVDKVKKVILNTISRQVSDRELPWSSGFGSGREDYDVTFNIPLSNENSMRISYRM